MLYEKVVYICRKDKDMPEYMEQFNNESIDMTYLRKYS